MKVRMLLAGGVVVFLLAVFVMAVASPRKLAEGELGRLRAGWLDPTCPYACQSNWVMCGSYTPATPACVLEDRTQNCPLCGREVIWKRCPTQMQEMVANPQLQAACPNRGLGQGLCYIHVQTPLICYSFQRKYCTSTQQPVAHYCKVTDLTPTWGYSEDVTCATGANRGDVETYGSVLACD